MAEAWPRESCFFPTDIVFLRTIHEMVHSTGHSAHDIEGARGTVCEGEGRSSRYHPMWGTITQRPPGKNVRWYVRVSERKVFSLLHIDGHPCTHWFWKFSEQDPQCWQLIRDYWRIMELLCWELDIRLKRTSEPALQLAASGEGLVCWFWRPGNWGPEVFRRPPLGQSSVPGTGLPELPLQKDSLSIVVLPPQFTSLLIKIWLYKKSAF